MRGTELCIVATSLSAIVDVIFAKLSSISSSCFFITGLRFGSNNTTEIISNKPKQNICEPKPLNTSIGDLYHTINALNITFDNKIIR